MTEKAKQLGEGRVFAGEYDTEWYEGLSKREYQLFDYLHELKIDYRGLIEAGLAIDCNTLDINPYK